MVPALSSVRLVLDCNVDIAAGLTSGICAQVVVEAVRHYTLVVSDPVLAEYQTVAARRKLQRAAPRLRVILDTIEAVALWIEPSTTVFGIEDPDDEIYLQTPEGGGAAALITGNPRAALWQHRCTFAAGLSRPVRVSRHRAHARSSTSGITCLSPHY